MNCVSTENYANRDILDNAHVETQFIASYHIRFNLLRLNLYV